VTLPSLGKCHPGAAWLPLAPQLLCLVALKCFLKKKNSSLRAAVFFPKIDPALSLLSALLLFSLIVDFKLLPMWPWLFCRGPLTSLELHHILLLLPAPFHILFSF